MKNITIVLGRICSGKDFFCSQYPDYFHLPTSTVVKEITSLIERTQLAGTKHLHNDIANKIVEYISIHPKIIIDGIRQVEILNSVIDSVGEDNITILWLDVPEIVRRTRFYNRNDVKDLNTTFEYAEQGDKHLGIDELERIYYNRSTKIKNY